MIDVYNNLNCFCLSVEIWSSKNTNELLGRIKQALPTMDNLKYSTQMDRLDWTTVEFGEYSGEDCKKQWNNIVIKVNDVSLVYSCQGCMKQMKHLRIAG